MRALPIHSFTAVRKASRESAAIVLQSISVRSF
jgi:hypothetical protein